VLFGKRRAYQRKIAVADFIGVCSGDIYVLEPSNEKLLPELLPFICQTDSFFEHAVGTSAGSLSPRTNWKSLSEYEFALPPLEEQRRIVEALLCFEASKLALWETSKCLRQLGVSISGAFLEGCEWPAVRFRDVGIEIIDGDRGKAYPSRSQLGGVGFCLFLSAKNVTTNGFVFDECEFISKERDQLLRKGKLARNDVVLTTRGTLGNVAHYDCTVPYEDMRINSGMVIFRCLSDSTDCRFLYHVLRSPRFARLIETSRSGSAQPQLPIRTLNEFEIPLPPIEKQKEIAMTLDRLSLDMRACNARLAGIQEMSARLLERSLESGGK